jgi:Ca-activated chloride channel family protein
MSFAYPAFLWLLLAVPPGMFVFFWWSRRTRQQLMTQFIQARLLPGLLAGISTTREKIRAAALIAAAVCLILSLARPQWGYDLEEVKQRGLDIVIAIDTSKSMLAEDIAPNRLARAKYAALDLMQQAKSDRLGLVAFAGSAFLQCPLTIDDAAFRQSVEALDVNTLPEGGTDIADAITTAQEAFKEGDSYKVLVLFTDGEDQDSGALEAAKKAKEAGLIIFTIGIGSAEGELLRIKGENGQTDYVRDENGNVVKSHLNEALLQEIAGPSPQGFYLPLRGANTIDVLYQKGLAPLPKSDSLEKWVRRAREQYHWPLALAILLLIAEILFPERKRETAPAASAQARTALARAALLLALLMVPAMAHGSPSSALREYHSGKYDEALKEYEQAIEKKSDDPRLHFNAGAAAYRSGQFDEAIKHFDQTLGSPDLNLQEQAYYNLGNALYHLGESNPDPGKKTENWEDSLKKYENSMKLNPQDADAKFNHAFVQKRLEELKKQQQQQQKQDQNKDNQDKNNQDQNQNQKNDQSKNDQQKNSESQQQQDQKNNSSQQQQQQQQQAKNQSQPKPDQNQQQEKKNQESRQDQEKKSQEKKDQQAQKQQEAKSAAEQQKKDQQSGEQPEQAAVAGQMTQQQAKQLLDSQKNDELMLPINRKEKENAPQRPIKDW